MELSKMQRNKGLVIKTDNTCEIVDLTYSDRMLDDVKKILFDKKVYLEVVTPRGLPQGYCLLVDEDGIANDRHGRIVTGKQIGRAHV